jgi:N-acetylmuramic acid 6-phosphate etherase
MKPRPSERITERTNPASVSLDTKSTREILRLINREDHRVAPAIRATIPQIARAVDLAVEAIRNGGRLVYLGAGTSGRLGVLDAAECLPTFGTTSVVGMLAGGPPAMLTAVEGSEDDERQAVRDLRAVGFTTRDILVGISASGRTPYTLAGMRYARRLGAKVVALCSNSGSAMERAADVALVPRTGPEVVAGSTRMKAGTAQKLVLNMLSTATMVRLGRVFSNLMVNVQLTNEKLRRRAQAIVVRETGASATAAQRVLRESGGNLPVALLMLWKRISRDEAARLVADGKNIAAVLREAQEESRKQIKRQKAKGKSEDAGSQARDSRLRVRDLGSPSRRFRLAGNIPAAFQPVGHLHFCLLPFDLLFVGQWPFDLPLLSFCDSEAYG